MHPLTKEDFEKYGIEALYMEFGVNYDTDKKPLSWFYNVDNQSFESPTYPVTINSTKLKDSQQLDMNNLGNLYADWIGYKHGIVDDGHVIGQIIEFPAPGNWNTSKWIECKGQSVTKAAYPELYEVIKYTYGGSGNNFTIPDLRGRVVMGKTAASPLGTTGGSKDVTLTEFQVPPHFHIGTYGRGVRHSDKNDDLWKAICGFDEVNVPNNTIDYSVNDVNFSVTGRSGAFNYSCGAENGSGGTCSAHTNVQPYITLLFLIKYK
jgi:microcystin-dependent protein